MKNKQRPVKASTILKEFLKNEHIIKRFLRRFVSSRHDIEDICQETILRALEAEKARAIHEPKAFLFGVSRNIVRKRLDKQATAIIDFIADFTPQEYIADEPLPEDCVSEQQRMLIFLEAASRLPRQCQRVFMMKKVYGYSHKEIAKQMGISISTVEKHVATGLKRCRDHMQRAMTQTPNSGAMTSLHGKAPGKVQGGRQARKRAGKR